MHRSAILMKVKKSVDREIRRVFAHCYRLSPVKTRIVRLLHARLGVMIALTVLLPFFLDACFHNGAEKKAA